MRQIPEDQLKAIQAKAEELKALVDEADCRLIGDLGEHRGNVKQKET